MNKKIYEVAKELGVEVQDLIDLINKDYIFIKDQMDELDNDKITYYLNKSGINIDSKSHENPSKFSNEIQLIIEKNKAEILYSRARKGDTSILNDPRVDVLKDHNNETPLHVIAHVATDKYYYKDYDDFYEREPNIKLVKQILQHPSAFSAKGFNEETPAHIISKSVDDIEVSEIIFKHPLVDKLIDNDGQSLLHSLALKSDGDFYEQVFNHKSMDKIINNDGRSPLHLLALTCKDNIKFREKILNHSLASSLMDNFGKTPKSIIDEYCSRKQQSNNNTNFEDNVIVCSDCGGSGIGNGYDDEGSSDCPYCGGTGRCD